MSENDGKNDGDVGVMNTGTEILNVGTETMDTGTENKIIAMIAENPRITITEMADRIGMSRNGIRYSMNKHTG